MGTNLPVHLTSGRLRKSRVRAVTTNQRNHAPEWEHKLMTVNYKDISKEVVVREEKKRPVEEDDREVHDVALIRSSFVRKPDVARHASGAPVATQQHYDALEYVAQKKEVSEKLLLAPAAAEITEECEDESLRIVQADSAKICTREPAHVNGSTTIVAADSFNEHVHDRQTGLDLFHILNAFVLHLCDRTYSPYAVSHWCGRIPDRMGISTFIRVILFEPVDLIYVVKRDVCLWKKYPSMSIPWDVLDNIGKFSINLLAPAVCRLTQAPLFANRKVNESDPNYAQYSDFMLNPLATRFLDPMRSSLVHDLLCVHIQAGCMKFNGIGMFQQFRAAVNDLWIILQVERDELHISAKLERERLKKKLDQVEELWIDLTHNHDKIYKYLEDYLARGNLEFMRRKSAQVLSRCGLDTILSEIYKTRVQPPA